MVTAAPSRKEAENLVVFEQPLSERMRTFLRLEFLYHQTMYHAENASSWGGRAAVGSLLDILSILTRGDVRSDVLKELDRQTLTLSRYQTQPGVDKNRLQGLLNHITTLQQGLTQAGTQYTQSLKESEFLNSVKHRSAIPGGTCEFDLPDYRHWLNKPFATREGDFGNWINLLTPLCESVSELLWITRASGASSEHVANRGLFQHSLERNTPCQLIRVSLSSQQDCFPEISGGQHRFTVRFLAFSDVRNRPSQVDQDVPFVLTCC